MPRHASAAVEAEEEAGVIGAVCPTPIGSYEYRKRRANGASIMYNVEVFPLAVTNELDDWKESSEERRVGEKCVSTCKSLWSPDPIKKKNKHSSQEKDIQKK